MTFHYEVCHYAAKVGNANLRLSGYAIAEDAEQLDLFVCIYAGADELTSITDTETKSAAEQCLRFLAQCAEGRLAGTMDESNDAHALAVLDVFEQEPLPPGHPLCELANVVITPHISAGTKDALQSKMDACFANLARVARGESPLDLVAP